MNWTALEKSEDLTHFLALEHPITLVVFISLHSTRLTLTDLLLLLTRFVFLCKDFEPATVNRRLGLTCLFCIDFDFSLSVSLCDHLYHFVCLFFSFLN